MVRIERILCPIDFSVVDGPEIRLVVQSVVEIGTARGTKSTINPACKSQRIRSRPTKPYRTSGGKVGNAAEDTAGSPVSIARQDSPR